MAGIYSEIEQLSLLKGIDSTIVMDAVKDAILVAARKYYKSDEELVAEFNGESGNVDVFAIKTVSDLVADPAREISLAEARKYDRGAEIGTELRYAVPTAQLGRISAQMAKQVIFQKIREAERDTICAEFVDRIGTLETCTVKRIEGPDLIADLGRTEARLPRREQSRLESFSPGDRVRVVIKTIEKVGRGPAVIISRASEDLVRRLFEQEVPEIYDGTVQIRACAREAGERTKIAVQSGDRDVDAVGACVGMKGMRVQSIIRELRGEKIDIIEYSEDPIEMATRGLSPARISRVTILDPVERRLEVVVDEMQLSLAIGKKGQNVRLGAKLMGWRIDIKGEDEKRQEVEEAMAAMTGGGTPVSVLIDQGLPEEVVDKLVEAGSATVEALADMTPEQLEQVEGVDSAVIETIQLVVNSYYAQFQSPVQPQDEEFLDPEAEASEEESAEPAVLPGLPAEGAADDDDDDEEIPMDDFDTMGTHASAPRSEQESEELADQPEIPVKSANAGSAADLSGNSEAEGNENVEQAGE